MASLKKSPWIIHYDGSSCNGCDIEIVACLTPVYDIERLGIINMGNPKHSDVFLITGAINEQNKEVVRNLYEQMPDPKVVVAFGTCATSGCVFADCYNILGGVDKVIPVDVYVPGCAVRPEAIMDGIIRSLEILEQKNKVLKEMASGARETTIGTASAEDAPEILALQKLAYQSEAEIHSDFTIPPMAQSLEELKHDFERTTFFKAVMNEKIIGSVRAFTENGSCYISGLMVNPVYHHHGIGRKLMQHAERHSAGAKRFEVFTFHKSRQNIVFFQGLGFKIFKREKVSENRVRVYMEKR